MFCTTTKYVHINGKHSNHTIREKCQNISNTVNIFKMADTKLQKNNLRIKPKKNFTEQGLTHVHVVSAATVPNNWY